MTNIVIYFNNNNKLEYPIDKAAFTNNDGSGYFHFGENNRHYDIFSSDLVEEGQIVVNWNNVSFIKFKTVEDILEED